MTRLTPSALKDFALCTSTSLPFCQASLKRYFEKAYKEGGVFYHEEYEHDAADWCWLHKGSNIKARPGKRQKKNAPAKTEQPVRPAVTLLPRVHEGYKPPEEDEVKPGDSVSQVGVGPYEREGFVAATEIFTFWSIGTDCTPCFFGCSFTGDAADRGREASTLDASVWPRCHWRKFCALSRVARTFAFFELF